MSFFAGGVVLSALAHAGAVMLLVAERLGGRRVSAAAPAGVVAVLAGATLATSALTGDVDSVVVVALGLAALVATAFIALPGFFPTAVLLVATYVALSGFGVVWGAWFVATMPVSTLTRCLMLAGLPLVLVGLPAATVETFEKLGAAVPT